MFKLNNLMNIRHPKINPVLNVEDYYANWCDRNSGFHSDSRIPAAWACEARVVSIAPRGAKRNVVCRPRFWPERVKHASPFRLGRRRVFHTLVDRIGNPTPGSAAPSPGAIATTRAPHARRGLSNRSDVPREIRGIRFEDTDFGNW